MLASDKVSWISQCQQWLRMDLFQCDNDLQMSFSLYPWTLSVMWTSWRFGLEEGRCLPVPLSVAFQGLLLLGIWLSVATMLQLCALCLMAVIRTVVSSSPGGQVSVYLVRTRRKNDSTLIVRKILFCLSMHFFIPWKFCMLVHHPNSSLPLSLVWLYTTVYGSQPLNCVWQFL